MPEKNGNEGQKFLTLMDRLTQTLKSGKPFDRDLTAPDFQTLLLGGLSIYAGKLEEQKGLRIIILDRENIKIITNFEKRRLHLQIRGHGQKKLARMVWSPAVDFVLESDIKNADKPGNLNVISVKVTPTTILGFNIGSDVLPTLSGSGFQNLLLSSLKDEMRGRGVRLDYLGLSIQPSGVIRCKARGASLK